MTHTYLVSGAQGFIGRYTVASLLAADSHAVVVGCGRSEARSTTFTHTIKIDEQETSAPLTPALIDAFGSAGSRYRYVRADISDAAAWSEIFAAYRPDVVIHLASGLRDDAADKLIRTNITGTIRLVEAANAFAHPPTRIVFGSSGSIYGAPTELPIREEYCGVPRDLYAVSKLAAEHAANVRLDHTRTRAIFARIFNVVGPGQEERHVVGKVASQLSAIAKKKRPALLELGDLSPTRDFIDVRDVADALVVLATHEDASGAYNLASGKEASIDSIVRRLLKLADPNSEVQLEQSYKRALDINRHFADITKLQSLGYAAKIEPDRSLEDVYSYYRTSDS
jgi:nucleoside-diphosphate-sugar epimerase